MANELTMTDGQRLHRRMLECPEDDAPRLILSDWLEEHGEEERARFIRWQVSGEISNAEAEYREGEPYGNPDEINVLAFDSMRRMRAGWAKFFPEFKGSARVVMSRGFISEVCLTCEQFCGGTCRVCDGDRGSCPRCGGTGRIEGVARELFMAHPITRVVLVDRKPNDQVWGNLIEFGWYVIDTHPDQRMPYDLPAMLREHMPMRDDTSESVWHWYPAESAALAALSAACVAHGRKLAGLPPLADDSNRQ